MVTLTEVKRLLDELRYINMRRNQIISLLRKFSNDLELHIDLENCIIIESKDNKTYLKEPNQEVKLLRVFDVEGSGTFLLEVKGNKVLKMTKEEETK